MDAGTDAGMDAGTDAGMDAGTDAGTDAGPSCDPIRPPARPGTPDGADEPQIIFALRDVVLDQADDVWLNYGYDLDGYCTNIATERSCEPPLGGTVAIDGERGLDNAAGERLLSILVEGFPTVAEQAQIDQASGRAAVVLRVRGYNGLDDDPSVEVALMQSVHAIPEGGTLGDDPAWDGRDRWYVSEADFVSGDPEDPLVLDDTAYVAGRTLVMEIPAGRGISFPWSGLFLELRLTGGVLTGEISADGTLLSNVQLAGRWPSVDLRDALDGIGLCPGDPGRSTAELLLSSLPDIREDPSDDGLGVTCNAFSVGIGMLGYRARWGGVVTPTPTPDPCP